MVSFPLVIDNETPSSFEFVKSTNSLLSGKQKYILKSEFEVEGLGATKKILCIQMFRDKKDGKFWFG